MVEDETDLMQLYRDALSGAGHEVDGFTDSVDAYSRFQVGRCAAVVLLSELIRTDETSIFLMSRY